MIIADWVAVSIMLLMALRVMFVGFLDEFTRKSGLLVGALAALLFNDSLTSYIVTFLTDIDRSIVFILSFSVLFVAGFLAMKFLLSVMTQIFELLHMKIIDHILGFAFGAIEGGVLVSIVVYALQRQPVIDVNPFLQGSQIISIFMPIAPYSFEIIRGELSEYIQGVKLRKVIHQNQYLR